MGEFLLCSVCFSGFFKKILCIFRGNIKSLNSPNLLQVAFSNGLNEALENKTISSNLYSSVNFFEHVVGVTCSSNPSHLAMWYSDFEEALDKRTF